MSERGLDKLKGPWDLVADLMDVAGGDDALILKALLVRSGWAWECERVDVSSRKCGTITPTTEHACQNCGVMRAPLELRLCEIRHVGLKPNQPYIFTIDPDCADCHNAAVAAAGL